MVPELFYKNFPESLHIGNMGHGYPVFEGILGTRIGSLESKKIIESLESEKIGSLESDKSGPYRAVRGT